MAVEKLAPPREVARVEGITEYEFGNGLKLLLVPDPSKPTVTVNLTVFVGSRHEGYGEAGMAHLLEHMVFKGTPTHAQIPQLLQSLGARFNGTTWVDRTNYFETLPSTPENLEKALHLEADRLINSNIKGEDLASEMTVVRNEFERGENSPSRILGQRMMATAFEWHNYGKSTIGNRSDIERVPVEKLRDFYRRFYQPDNAMVVIAGKFDEKQALAAVQKHFGSIPRPQRELDKTYTEEPAQDGEREVILRRVGEVAVVGSLYHVPAGAHPDFAALELLESILTSAPSGRLYQALVETKRAASISGAAFAWHDPGVLRLMAEVNKGNAPEGVLENMLDVLEQIGEKGVTEEEVERARVQFLKQRELSAANTSAIAVELSEWQAQGDWRLYFLFRDRVEAVKPDDVKRVAAKYLKRDNRTVGLYIPTEKAERVEIPTTPNVPDLVKSYKGREEIALGEAFDVSPANIEKRTERTSLGKGVKAALLPKKTRGEVVQVRVTIRYGSPKSLGGLTTECEFLPELMTRGTKKLTRQQLTDELDRRRARLTANGSAGIAIFSVQTKKADLLDVLDLLRQVLREPSLPANELDILKHRQLASLEESSFEPRSLASRSLARQLSPYPKDDVRYVATIPEEIEMVKGLTREALEKLYIDYLGAQQIEVSVVGDFDVPATKQKLTAMLADWKAPQPYARIERSVPESWKPGVQTIETPEKANAVYYAGVALPIRDDDPDYAALVIGDFVLGAGALSSRLGDRIRQREGLSYGVASTFNADSLDQRGTLSIFAICNPSNMKKVEVAAKEELDRLLKEGLGKEELERAVTGYLQRQEVSRTDDGGLAQTLNSTLFVGRTMDYYAKLEQQIRELTPEQVQQAMKKRIPADKLIVIEAGDFAALSTAGK